MDMKKKPIGSDRCTCTYLKDEYDHNLSGSIYENLKTLYATGLYRGTADSKVNQYSIDTNYYNLRDSMLEFYYSEVIDLFVSTRYKNFYKNVMNDLLDESESQDDRLLFSADYLNDDLDLIELALRSPSQVYYPTYNRVRTCKRNPYIEDTTIKDRILRLQECRQFDFPNSAALIRIDPVYFMCTTHEKLNKVRQDIFNKV